MTKKRKNETLEKRTCTGVYKRCKKSEQEEDKKVVQKKVISEYELLSDEEKKLGFFEILTDCDISRFVGFTAGSDIEVLEIQTRTKDLDEYDLHIGLPVGKWIEVKILEKTNKKHSVYDDPEAIENEIEEIKKANSNDDSWMDLSTKISLPVFQVESDGNKFRAILVNSRIARSLDHNKLYFWRKKGSDWIPSFDESNEYIEEEDEYTAEDFKNNSGSGIMVHTDGCNGDCFFVEYNNDQELREKVDIFVNTIIEYNIFVELSKNFSEEELGFLYLRFLTILKGELKKQLFEQIKNTKNCLTAKVIENIIKKISRETKHQIFK